MDNIPIWYVIMTYETPGHIRQVWRVLKSIPCLMRDVEKLFVKEVQPLMYGTNMPIQAYIFAREVENPITAEKTS